MGTPCRRLRGAAAWLVRSVLLLPFAVALPAQVVPPIDLVQTSCTQVVDPKLPGAGVQIAFEVQSAQRLAEVEVLLVQQGATVGTILARRVATGRPIVHVWDGRTVTAGTTSVAVVPGRYDVRIVATGRAPLATDTVDLPLHVVRLGVTAIAARSSQAASEWQMVYFKRGTAAAFYGVPALREYRNVADAGQVSDLDYDDGQPRPPVPLHTDTASPALEGLTYEDDRYNYPLCFRAGTQPTFAVTFGSTCTGPAGVALPVVYPTGGLKVRCAVGSSLGAWVTPATEIVAGGTVDFVGPALPADAGRTDVALQWSFQGSLDGGATWTPIPGGFTTQHRFYTQLSAPLFANTAGVQHSGPWVEVADYLHQWKSALAIDTSTADGVTAAVILGFGGQVGSLTTAIEGVRYDAYPLGGDGGASHYYTGTHSVQLSRLLDAHANGVFVNCSDCAASTAAMLGMLGVADVQMQRLGAMTLRAIRGIGAPAYTLSLWGSAHSFSYHHIVTRTGGAYVCDACMWVDEDGNPNALPGLPGYNVDRPWTHYAALAASNVITFQLESLPTLN
ncbi:MAG: hypothetical protein JNL08_20695 [Planctomycetes bacterium]|nr:hypothetical protein [Planctomycetota bacterium]